MFLGVYNSLFRDLLVSYVAFSTASLGFGIGIMGVQMNCPGSVMMAWRIAISITRPSEQGFLRSISDSSSIAMRLINFTFCKVSHHRVHHGYKQVLRKSVFCG